MEWKRIGIALGERRGATNRRAEYEVIVDPEFPESWRLRYTGYREQQPTGEVWVGLALGGPNWRPQPIIDFANLKGSLEVHLFKEDS